MRPHPGTVLHFSEDPTIVEFLPHVAATSSDPEPVVWAVDADRAPDFWFPRACPRALAWATSTTTDEDRRTILASHRVHAIGLRRLTGCRRNGSTRAEAAGHNALADVPPIAGRRGRPEDRPLARLGPRTVGDLIGAHDRAAQLRLVSNLWP